MATKHIRNVWKGFAIAIGGALCGAVCTVAAGFLLSDFRRYACPAGTFIYGSTNLGAIITILPWFFVGMFAYWTTIDFVSGRVFKASKNNGRLHRTKDELNWSKTVRKTTGILALLAALVSPFGLFTGFCGTADGITFKSAPWAPLARYEWRDAVGVTLICYYVPGRRYGGNYNSFTLEMADGAEINLYETARSFNEGYQSLRDVLKNVPLRYDNSQVRSSCLSSLRNLRPVGSRN